MYIYCEHCGMPVRSIKIITSDVRMVPLEDACELAVDIALIYGMKGEIPNHDEIIKYVRNVFDKKFGKENESK
jgi:hypothetical protein